jgi:alkaline phosphatase
MLAAPDTEKTLGIFTTSNMAKWLDRNVYRQNLNQSLSPTGDKTPALDQPGLKDMTLKAIDILQARSGDEGFFLMSEAASIDKMMHVLDYDRALGELLELDDTIKATIAKLNSTDCLKETLILVTADHGHGFDVMGSVDTHYLAAQNVDRKKRDAIGTYEQSGLSQYINTGNLTYTDSNFPSNWDPRYTLFQGLMADPDRRENWKVHKNGPRTPAKAANGTTDYYVNPKDGEGGILLNGTLPVENDQGVHSLTDVPVFAMGPCQELFGGGKYSFAHSHHSSNEKQYITHLISFSVWLSASVSPVELPRSRGSELGLRGFMSDEKSIYMCTLCRCSNECLILHPRSLQ